VPAKGASPKKIRRAIFFGGGNYPLVLESMVMPPNLDRNQTEGGSPHFPHTETEGFRKGAKTRGLTDVSTRRCDDTVFGEGWRAPWDTFVSPQVFADHSGGGGVTL
jgi:hypothetical protein